MPETCITGMRALLAASHGFRDDRVELTVRWLLEQQLPDGRWPGHRAHPGRRWFLLETGSPSRWATLRSLRVLRSWQRSR